MFGQLTVVCGRYTKYDVIQRRKMANLSETSLCTLNCRHKTVLYPCLGLKQDDEFIKLLTKQFIGSRLIEVEDVNNGLAGYHVVKEDVEQGER